MSPFLPLEPGFAHIKTMLETGREILGLRELALDGNEPGLFLDAGSGADVLQGGVYQRKATRADEQLLPVLPTHGYMVLKLVAEELAKKRRALTVPRIDTTRARPNEPLHRTAAASMLSGAQRPTGRRGR